MRNGNRVVCVTATRGEAADPERWPPAELAVIREAEIAAALEILGVTDHRWLDYPDGGCAAVDAEDAVARIAAIIEEVRPDTVLTFGPDGGTGHPDHIAVCAWTQLAVIRANTGAALYFSTEHRRVGRPVRAGGDRDGRDDGRRLDAAHARRKTWRSTSSSTATCSTSRSVPCCAQATQVLEMRDAMGHELYREILREEAFRRP